MQLYALNRFSKIVFAKNANKKETYFCLECGTKVRCRGGFYKQSHFYHLDLNRHCRQNGKSEEHLAVQLFLQHALFGEEVILEKPFKEINRIADVFWVSKKIVFEVQCSPILESEVKERNEDYQSLGLRVIWILHDRRYNQKWLTASESFLQGLPCYFTDLDKRGIGMIYDSFWLAEKGRRVFSTPRFPVSMALCDLDFGKLKKRKKEMPELLWKRVERQKFCFQGDLMSLMGKEGFYWGLFKEALELEKRRAKWTVKFIFYHLVIRPYKIFFNMLLERASKA